ncbi:unnamed protein product, partial [Choristocarpus tenellus]
MEWCDVDLHRLISRGGAVEEGKMTRYVKHIAMALAHCHERGIAHNDVKPENVLIRHDIDTAKLCDFGSSTIEVGTSSGSTLRDHNDALEWDTSPFSTSSCYMAPEARETLARVTGGRGLDRLKTDMWSLGVLIYLCVCGCAPWRLASEQDPDFRRFIAEGLDFYPSHLSMELKTLLSRLLSTDVGIRPSASEVCNSSWVTMGSDSTVS